VRVYIEIVLIDNFLADFLLLRMIGRLLPPRPRRMRVILAALLGTLYAVLAPVKPFLFLLQPHMKIGSSCLIVWVAYGWNNGKAYLLHLLAFYGFSAAFGGLISAAGTLLGETVSAGGILAVSGPPLWLFLLLVFLAEKAFGHFAHAMQRRRYSLLPCSIEYTLQGEKTAVPGMIDTGNALYDPVSGLPVIVLPLREELQQETRKIPIATAAGQSTVQLIWPQDLILRQGEWCVSISAWLGFAADYHGTVALIPLTLANTIQGGEFDASDSMV